MRQQHQLLNKLTRTEIVGCWSVSTEMGDRAYGSSPGGLSRHFSRSERDPDHQAERMDSFEKAERHHATNARTAEISRQGSQATRGKRA